MPKNQYKITKELTDALREAIREKPGICAPDLAAALSISESKLSGVARALSADGRITRKRVGHHFGYYLPDHIGDVPPVQIMTPSDIRPADIVELAELDAIREELESLRAEVKDLRAFKERALVAHPDLGVDPLVLEAREIVAELHPNHREKILSGAADNYASVTAAIAALRRAKGTT